tara:strand:+ start:90 stop:329 length:240 start_codon:yes stop_codon:yes gene_type:complete
MNQAYEQVCREKEELLINYIEVDEKLKKIVKESYHGKKELRDQKNKRINKSHLLDRNDFCGLGEDYSKDRDNVAVLDFK